MKTEVGMWKIGSCVWKIMKTNPIWEQPSKYVNNQDIYMNSQEETYEQSGKYVNNHEKESFMRKITKKDPVWEQSWKWILYESNHENGSLRWTIMWVFKDPFLLNFFPHIVHSNGLSPVWISRWRSKSVFPLKPRPQ